MRLRNRPARLKIVLFDSAYTTAYAVTVRAYLAVFLIVTSIGEGDG